MVPIYIKYLGLEAYGLISFYTTLIVFLQILDLGIYQTLIGEISRNILSTSKKVIATLFHSLAIINITIAITIMLFFYFFSDWISSNWFSSNSYSKEDLKEIIFLIGLLIGVRWPILIYQGGLYGFQKISEACFVNITMVILNSIGSFLILFFFEPNIKNIFYWQIIIGFIYVITIRFLFWKCFGVFERLSFSVALVKKIFKHASQMAGVTITSITLSNIDKIILSKIIPLNDFAIYMLANNMSNILQIIINPIHNILYPKFGELFANNDLENLSRLYSFSLKCLSIFIFPISIMIFFSSYELVLFYTQDDNLASIAAPILSILIISQTFNGLMYLPFTLQLGSKQPKIPLYINISFIIICIPMLVYLANHYGSIGAAITWLFINTVYFIVGPYITHKFILKNNYKKFYITDVGPYLISALILFTILKIIFIYFNFKIMVKISLIFISTFLLFNIFIILTKDLRNLIVKMISKIYAMR